MRAKINLQFACSATRLTLKIWSITAWLSIYFDIFPSTLVNFFIVVVDIVRVIKGSSYIPFTLRAKGFLLLCTVGSKI